MIVIVLIFFIFTLFYSLFNGGNEAVYKSMFLVSLTGGFCGLVGLIAKNNFKNFTVRRNILNNKVSEGEECSVELIIENNKRLPLVFFMTEEILPIEFEFNANANVAIVSNQAYHKMKGNIYSYERRKKKYSVRINKRGVYYLRNIGVKTNDFLALSKDQYKEFDSLQEIVVYPKIKSINSIKFKDESILGEKLVRRWIHKDPIFIKGIREYSSQDRMRDIHWNSSMKQNKLMVKEYDYTSNREVVIIVSTQCHEQMHVYMYEECFNKAVDISVSICGYCLKQGIPVGLWTNSYIKSIKMETKGETPISCNSMENILEVCARLDMFTRTSTEEYLTRKLHSFRENNVYVIVAPYLSLKTIEIIKHLTKRGIVIKIIDVSLNGDIPNVIGVEKQEVYFEERYEKGGDIYEVS